MRLALQGRMVEQMSTFLKCRVRQSIPTPWARAHPCIMKADLIKSVMFSSHHLRAFISETKTASSRGSLVDDHFGKSTTQISCVSNIFTLNISKNKIVTVLLSKAYIYIYMPYLTRLWLFYFIYIYIYIYIYISEYTNSGQKIYLLKLFKNQYFWPFFLFFCK